MAEDIKELIQFLGEKFEKIDERFDGVDKKFEKIDERFNDTDKRLDIFEKNIDDKFDTLLDVFATKEELQEVRREMATKNDIHQLMMAIDSYAKRSDTYFQEMVALSHKVDRHERWFQIFADKLGLKLEY